MNGEHEIESRNGSEPAWPRRSAERGAPDVTAAAGASSGTASAAGGSAAPSSAGPGGFDPPPPVPGVVPFHVDVPQAALDDLQRRLAATRWPDRETVTDWSQGVPLDRLQALVAYWRDGYDWRRAERALNRFPQFRTEIDGLGIHFVHARSKHPDAMPILLTHGWPGSIFELLPVIEPLTDPTAHGGAAGDAFHVVVPSLPGYGFSDKPTATGWNMLRVAGAWTALMQRLGYARWVAQGGDWGAVVAIVLAKLKPAGLAGIHVNFPMVFPNPIPTSGLSSDEQAAVAAVRAFRDQQYGYFLQQQTRPQTIGYALTDSPVGQAAWIYEKFHAWTDHDDTTDSALGRDDMLDDITLYWLTGTAASSARTYWENPPKAPFSGGLVEIPVGVSVFPKELFRAPRSWTERAYPQLIHFNQLARGGHFAALEQPALLVSEIRATFAGLR